MMYDSEGRRITVYKYLKGNIKEGERLFTAVEGILTGNKGLHREAVGNWIGLGGKTEQSLRSGIKPRNVILRLVFVVRSHGGRKKGCARTEDPHGVNHIFLILLASFFPSQMCPWFNFQLWCSVSGGVNNFKTTGLLFHWVSALWQGLSGLLWYLLFSFNRYNNSVK